MILKQVIKYDNAVAIEATWVDENDVAVKCQAYSNAQMAELAADIGADAAKYKYLMDEIAVTYVAPEKHVPIRKSVIRDWEFRNRFTQAQLVGVMRAALSGDDVAALVWLALCTASDGVDLDKPENIDGVKYLAATYPTLGIDAAVVLA